MPGVSAETYISFSSSHLSDKVAHFQMKEIPPGAYFRSDAGTQAEYCKLCTFSEKKNSNRNFVPMFVVGFFVVRGACTRVPYLAVLLPSL